MEELIKVIFEKPTNEKLMNSGIRIIKDKTLLSPGFWNGRKYSAEEIKKAYLNSDWSDKDVISLIADHKDDDKKGRPISIREWLGFISNQYLTEDGFLKGDLNLCDSDLATKLIDGKAKFGISPFVYGMYDGESQRDFVFKNFAVVVEPACKEAYINLSDDNFNEKLADISAFERIRKRLGKSLTEFYAIPRDPPSSSSLPIFDVAHVRNAMARFNQTNLNPEEKSKARSKIISAAKKFGIEIKEFEKLEDELDKEIDDLHLDEEELTKERLVETVSSDISGKEISSKGLQPIKTKKKKKVDSIQMKGGFKNMTEENEKPKIEEEIVEETKVEEEPEEEVVEEVQEEESEEKLLENIAKLAEKFLAKKALSPEQQKMNSMEKEIVFLKEEIKKLSQEKVAPIEKIEAKAEKLSANPKTIARTNTFEKGFTFCGNGPSSGSREFAAMLGY